LGRGYVVVQQHPVQHATIAVHDSRHDSERAAAYYGQVDVVGDGKGSVARDTTACPTIDGGKLVDNAAEQQVRWSSMEDRRNENATSVEDSKQWLAQRLQNEKAIRSQFIDVEATRAALARGGGVVWAESRIQAYGQAMKGARQEIAPLTHMIGGGPPRGSELVTVTYKNSANGDSRGTNIEDGGVRITTKYHKKPKRVRNANEGRKVSGLMLIFKQQKRMEELPSFVE
jgi:hypothetical protein